MIRILFLAAIAALLSSVAAAQPADIYPILEAGVVKVHAQAADSSADRADTASVAIVQLNSAAGGELQTNCAPDAGPGVTILFSSVLVENPGDGSPAELKARAYPGQGCTGDLFADSDNSAFVRFLAPGTPAVVDVSAGPPDITIP